MSVIVVIKAYRTELLFGPLIIDVLVKCKVVSGIFEVFGNIDAVALRGQEFIACCADASHIKGPVEISNTRKGIVADMSDRRSKLYISYTNNQKRADI